MAEAKDNGAAESESADACAGREPGCEAAAAGKTQGVAAENAAQGAQDGPTAGAAEAAPAAKPAEAAQTAPGAEAATAVDSTEEQTAVQEPAPGSNRPESKTPPLRMKRSSRRLVASSFGLMAVAGIAYGLCVPGLVSAMDARVAQAGGTSIVSSVVNSVGTAITGAVSALATEAPAAGTSAAATGEAGLRGSASLAGAGGLTIANTLAATTANPASAAATTDASTGSVTSPDTPATPDASVTPDTPDPETPDTGSAEDEEFHAYLVSALGELDSYVSQVNAAVATFNANAATASQADRLVYAEQCDGLTWSVFGFYGSVLNHPAPSGSKWASARSNLIGASNRLYRYIAQFDGSWDQNIQYEDAASGIDDWMEPVRDSATETALNEFAYYYERIAL